VSHAEQKCFQFSEVSSLYGASQPFKALSLLTLIFENKSWSPRNLYNLWKRTAGPKSGDILFKKTSETTLFQQRWTSKAAVRAYHGEYIPEKVFKRWYLPDSLPDVRPRRQIFSGDNLNLELYARRKLKEKQLEGEIQVKGLAPVGSLMFSEVERRIDTVVFRSCFAHSIYEARRLIIHGNVKLNGKKVCYGLSIDLSKLFHIVFFSTAFECYYASRTWGYDLR
jgi:ribosomal protein S4